MDDAVDVLLLLPPLPTVKAGGWGTGGPWGGFANESGVRTGA